MGEGVCGTLSAGTLSHAGDGGWHCVMPVSVWRQHTEGMVCVCECRGGKWHERRTEIIPTREEARGRGDRRGNVGDEGLSRGGIEEMVGQQGQIGLVPFVCECESVPMFFSVCVSVPASLYWLI